MAVPRLRAWWLHTNTNALHSLFQCGLVLRHIQHISAGVIRLEVIDGHRVTQMQMLVRVMAHILALRSQNMLRAVSPFQTSTLGMS